MASRPFFIFALFFIFFLQREKGKLSGALGNIQNTVILIRQVNDPNSDPLRQSNKPTDNDPPLTLFVSLTDLRTEDETK